MLTGGIDFINVSKAYGEQDRRKTVLRDVALTIKQGEFVGLAGRNGSGKSTMARMINGLLLPTSGKVLVNGMDTRDKKLRMQIRRHVGMVFQNPDNQIISSVVEEDIAFGPENLGYSPAEVRERIEWALEAVGMVDFRRQAPNLLSGGQKQRVAIAAALAMQPSYLILDEPTSMLDPWGRQELLTTLQTLHEKYRMTILMISHHMEDLVSVQRLLVLNEGRVYMDDRPEKVFEAGDMLEELGVCLPDVPKLVRRLRARGCSLDQRIVTVEQMVEYLCR